MARTSRGGGARRARASSPAAKVQRQAMPSSEELLNLIGSRPVAAAVGEFGGLPGVADEFYNPRKYRNLAGEAIGVYGGAGVFEDFPETTPAGEDKFYYIDSRGNYVDTSVFRQSYDVDDDTGELLVPGMRGPQEGESNLPAKISVVPTSTSNPNRPRTVAAGYDVERQVLTVVFRDGTWYNYYEVTLAEWKAFKATVSKGRYIYKVLDYKPRGDASMKGVAPGVRKNLYAISRAAQMGYKGKQKGIK
jgi:KTSC domain